MNIANFGFSGGGSQNLSGYVPYVGATQNIDLGAYMLTADKLALDITPTNPLSGVGQMAWNDTDGTLDIRLKGNNVTLQVGQELVARVVNKSSGDLLEANYQVVKVIDAQGQRLAVDLAQANTMLNSDTTLGVVTETILVNQEGFVNTYGQVRQINTTGSLQGETWTDGDTLYLSPTIAGRLTNVKPSAPNYSVVIGFVEYAHQNNGKIYVKIDTGLALQELSDVNIDTGTLANNNILAYNSATSVWTNKTLSALGGMTNPMTTAGDIIYGGVSGTPTRLGIGTTNYFLQAGASAPTWFNLFGTANTWALGQTIQLNSAVNRTITINPMSGSGSATAFAGTAGQAVTFSSGNFGTMITWSNSFNSSWVYPIYTLANRNIGGYTATVPQIQLRISTLAGTSEKNIEWAMPTNTGFTTYDVAIRYDLFHTSTSYRFVQHYMRTSIDTAGALNPASALLHIGAATTSLAQLNLKTSAGTNPSAPGDGDLWYDGTNVKFRQGATTKTFTLV